MTTGQLMVIAGALYWLIAAAGSGQLKMFGHVVFGLGGSVFTGVGWAMVMFQ